ncbi:hypothetical protein [Microbulbifer sp. SAOS-129_SWC]|uniref:LEM-3-like GIY-YIG domain-containing protein n=1 Tax=Microbulbifer sp. SAOS-129_SWC TaxID=3145235 RepID=UPI003216641B
MFTQSVIESLGYYVYFLQDPFDKEVFYIGKGVGNRIFDHLECAITSDLESEKLDRIREINNKGGLVEHFILRHGLTEDMSFEVEAALIDFVGMKNLSNLQSGHNSSDYGLKTVEEISSMYQAEEFAAEDPVILININKLYDRKMTEEELYQATRRSWVVGERREKAKYAIPTYRGLTREVYEIQNWVNVPEHGPRRFEFSGILADEDVRQKYRYKSIKKHFPKGAANPIKYVGLD